MSPEQFGEDGRQQHDSGEQQPNRLTFATTRIPVDKNYLQRWATNALRDFRASHRDEWTTEGRDVIGPALIHLIENELNPAYYV